MIREHFAVMHISNSLQGRIHEKGVFPSDLDSESGSPLVGCVRSLSLSGRLGSVHLRPVFPPTAACGFAHSSYIYTYNRDPASDLDCKYDIILAGVYRSDLVCPSLKMPWLNMAIGINLWGEQLHAFMCSKVNSIEEPSLSEAA